MPWLNHDFKRKSIQLVLLTMTTYDLFRVALVFPEVMNDTYKVLMVRLSHVQSQMKVGNI